MYVCIYIKKKIISIYNVSTRSVRGKLLMQDMIGTQVSKETYIAIKETFIIIIHAYLHENEEQIRVSASCSLTPAIGDAAEGNSRSKRRRVVAAQQVQRRGVKVGPDTNAGK